MVSENYDGVARGAESAVDCALFHNMNARSQIYFLTLYRKSEVANLSRDEIRILRRFVKRIQDG